MIRMSEAVLDGHPDKFCDILADTLIAEAYKVDPEAYGQIEVAVWSDLVWFSGATVTRSRFEPDLVELIRGVGRRIGYVDGNAVDASRYRVVGEPCFLTGDPTRWTHHVNDQCIVHGWAGYDERVAFLPPEHFLAHAFRQALVDSFSGVLFGQGPDGKLLVRLREEDGVWILEHVLVTLQHLGDTPLTDLSEGVDRVLGEAYRLLVLRDSRWARPWEDVQLLVNPNGPLINGGSDGDNGQTGRKLAMDFYGPRVPIGGGALSGKDLTHIDRAGAYAARQAAVEVASSLSGAECLVTLCYAPNVEEPLDVRVVCSGRGRGGGRLGGSAGRAVRGGAAALRGRPAAWFGHRAVRERFLRKVDVARLGSGRHFVEAGVPWNGRSGGAN